MDTLRVGAARPDPPFNGMPGDTGLDIDLMTEIAGRLGMAVEFLGYDAPDIDGVFDELSNGAYDCVVSGTTVTVEREKKAEFVAPYVISGQALAVDTARFPRARSVDDLAGLTIGVRRGDASEPIANELVEHGKAAAVRIYENRSIRTALTDMTAGDCDAVMMLAPVLNELVKTVDGIELVQRGLSVEHIAIAVRPADHQLFARIAVAQAELEDAGTLQRIRRKWLGNPYTDQNLAPH